jgi:DNA sulfur modification protein DndC
MRTQSIFESERLSMQDSMRLTAESLRAYGSRYKHWAIAYSGGKDSTGAVSAVARLIQNRQVPIPESLIVIYADTRMELPPLHASATAILGELQSRGIETKVVMPTLDDRFYVYMFGRGVPPPSNTFRWCTSQLKIEPMQRALEDRAVERGFGYWQEKEVEGGATRVYRGHDQDILDQDAMWRELWAQENKVKRALASARKKAPQNVRALESEFIAAKEARKRHEYWLIPEPRKILMLTGVRLGESAARDQRIVLSCSRDGAECGQGWFQETTSEHIANTLAPLLHWRVCHVWDWLTLFAPRQGFPTGTIAEVYGIYEDGSQAENGTRTGCVGCNLASRDTALDNLLKIPAWQYLAPLKKLRPLYAELKRPQYRLRKGLETKQDGGLVANPGRMGPLTMEGRRLGLRAILAIQDEINEAARMEGKQGISLINDEELDRIRELIEANTWPNRWDGTEALADEWADQVYRGGKVQSVMMFE